MSLNTGNNHEVVNLTQHDATKLGIWRHTWQQLNLAHCCSKLLNWELRREKKKSLAHRFKI